MTNRLLATITFALAVAVVGVNAQEHAQEQSVKAFATDLALHGVPPSFVVWHDQFIRGKASSVTQRTVTAKKRATFAAQLPNVVSAWNRTTPTVATLSNNFVRVTVPDEPAEVRGILNARVTVTPQSLTVADALSLLPALIRGDVQRAPLVGSGQAFQNCQWSRQVTLAGGPVTVQAYLDTLVNAAPGFVWLATFNRENPRQSFAISMACESGSYTRLTVFDGSYGRASSAIQPVADGVPVHRLHQRAVDHAAAPRRGVGN